MRRGSSAISTFQKAQTTFVVTLLVLGTFVLAVSQPGEDPPSPIPDWPADSDWINYTFRGERILDWEDKPYENDPTHGIANVQPAAVDIASGVDASGGGPENNPGDYTSVQYLYEDGNGDSSACSNLDDDWLFLRQRVAADPRHTGKYAYKAYHWDILMEVDGDIWSEFVVDLNGGDGYFKFGTVGVFYNNTEDYEYDPDYDWVWLQEASKESNDYTNPRYIDYGTSTTDDDQWWIEYRVPVTAFTDLDDNQLLCADTNFLLFFSTSASATNPLQKDWMGEYIFGEPANITVVKTVEEDVVAPGGTLHYKIYYNNTGDFNANHVWVNDTIPEYTAFIESYPDYDSVDGRTYRWHFTDVEPGNYTIYLNLSVDVNAPDGEILRNVAVLNYTDQYDNELPGSEDETQTTVEAPIMTMSKEADVATADPGDVIHYTIYYENTGSGDAYDVTIEDTIPEHTTFQDCYPDYDSVDGRTYTWVIGLVPGKTSGKILLNVTVDAYTEDGTELTNYVTLNYWDENGNQYPELEDSWTVTVTSPMMDVTKTADVTTADPSDTITYTITYENTGTGDASDVVIKDTIPEHTTFVSASPAYNEKQGTTYIWKINLVEGGDSGTITLKVKVDAYVADGTVLTNEVTLDYDDANGNPQGQETDSVDVTVTAPIMTVTKEADVTTADPEDQITYTITYENTGTGDATDVVIKDTIPLHTTLVSASEPYSGVYGRTYTWEIGDVCGGCSDYLIIVVEVDEYTADKTVLRNNVTLDYDDANGNPYPQESDYVEVTVTAPVMDVTKIADVSTADPGDEITYTISYENSGTGDATNVEIVDTIPADTTVVSATPAWTSSSGDKYTWDIGDVSAGGSGTISLVVKVDVGTEDGTVLTNWVSLYYEDANGNPYPNETDKAEVTVTSPIMTITKTVDVTTADPGDEITYTLEYENTGSGEATDVYIKDTIPDDVEFVSADPVYTSVSGNTYTWYFASVDGKSSGTITLVVKVKVGTPDETLLRNQVTLDYNDANGNPLPQESDSVDVTVTAPIFTFSKVADVSTADPGDFIKYTITYKNTGTGDATEVEITDTIPADTTLESTDPTHTSSSGDTYTWDLGTVEAGKDGTITVIVSVDAHTPDGTLLRNTATLDYSDANGNPYPQMKDYADVTVTAPVMTIAKTGNVDTADPGDGITYTITYKNTGTGTATNVVVADTIPPDTEFVSADPVYTRVSGNTYTWEIGDVCGGCEGSIELVVKVKVRTPDETVLTNYVTLNYDDANGNAQDEESDSFDVVVTAPVMTLVKKADTTTADPSDIIIYTIEYRNKGTGEATNVWINDTIPTDTTFVDSTPNYDSVSGNTYTWFFSSVGAKTSGEIKIRVQVDVGVEDGTLLRNTVTLDYADANGNPYDQLSDYVDVLVTAPVMSLTKTADLTTADPSDLITYTVEFTNSGSGNATNVYINDTIPDEVDFVSSNPAYTSVSGNTYTWYFALVGPSETVTILITVEVKAYTDDETVLHNTATLDYCDDNGNPYPTQRASATVTVTAPVMEFSKVSDVDTANPGDVIEYTISYKNTGTGDATGVKVTDVIPEHVEFVSSIPMYDERLGDLFTWNLSLVSAGSSGMIIIQVQVEVGTEDMTFLRNIATLYYADANGNPYSPMEDYADVRVTAPVMKFSKSADATTADPGDTITYTLTYENTGTGWASMVEIVDTIPEDTTFVSATPMYDSASGNEYTWTIGGVAPGGSGTITIVVSVNAGTPDETLLHNEATLDYYDANGNFIEQLSDYADVVVTAPILHLIKTADVSQATPGDTINYTIDYWNSGTGWASLVEIVDTLPADVMFIFSDPSYTSVSGNEYVWFIGDLAPGAGGSIGITVVVIPGTPDETLLHNEVTLDYADSNGNYYPQLTDQADVVVTAPVMTLEKTAGDVTIDAYIIADFELRVAGEKWHNVILELYDGNVSADFAEVVRYPGSPDEQAVTLFDVKISLLGDFWAIIKYTPMDDPINGQIWGDNPVWLTMRFPDGDYVRLFHNFNVRHNHTWIWIIDDFRPYLKREPIIFEAFVPYTITYENTGTGDATDVVITDTFPPGSVILDSSPMYDTCTDNVCTWYIGDVASGEIGYIFVNISYVFDIDGEVVTNEVTLDYDDANGNHIERLYASADSILIKPEIDEVPPGSPKRFDSGITTIPGTDASPHAVISSPLTGSYHYVGDTIKFDGSASFDDVGIESHLWSFGDGATDTRHKPSHVFTEPGIYTVQLTVTDSDGKMSSAYVFVLIKSKSLKAVMEMPTEEIIFEGTTVEFSGLAVFDGYGGPFKCSWDFGDGSKSSKCKTSHPFGDEGTYTVSLKVYDSRGNVAYSTTHITVLNVRPSVELAKLVHGSEGSQVHFTAEATDPGNDELTFVWNFGDGTVATGRDIYHTYEDNGFYAVTLTVTDGDGGSVVKVMTARIGNVAPSADAGPVKSALVGESVFFESAISDPGASDSLSIVWDMGDGTIYRGVLSPIHTYSATGVYAVVLTVEDDDGAKTMSKTWVYVTQYLDSTPLTLDEDNAATEEAPLPLAILALMVMAIIGLAVGSYLMYFIWGRLVK
jgi:uncharacterized repeat protein (TIGR01451 family)